MMRIAICAAFLLITLCSPAQTQNSLVAQGVALFRHKEYRKALIKFRDAEQAEPANATIENLLGITETQLGDITSADVHYHAAIRLAPDMAAPYKNLGFNDLNEKRYGPALEELQKALILSPTDGFVHYYLAILYLDTSRPHRAIAQLDAARPLIENDTLTAIEMVKACIQTDDRSNTRSLVDKLEQRAAISYAEEFQLGTMMSAKRMYGDAVARFQRAAEMDPSGWWNQYNLGIAMLDAGEYKSAVQVLRRLTQLRPSNPDGFSLLAAALESSGQLPGALTALQTAIQLKPQSQDLYLDYTRLLIEMNRYDDAVGMLAVGEKAVPDAYGLQLRLGAVEMMQDNYAAARSTFEKSIREHPEIVMGHIALAQTYMKQGNNTQAARVLDDARQQFPKDFMVEYFSGLVAERLGQNQKAVAEMQNAIRLAPKVPEPHFELGMLFLRENQIPNAQRQFELVVSLDPTMARAYYELSRVSARSGRKDEARKMAQKSEELMQSQRSTALAAQMSRLGKFHSDDAKVPMGTPARDK